MSLMVEVGFFFVLVGAVNAVVYLRVLDDLIAVCDSWAKLICKM